MANRRLKPMKVVLDQLYTKYNRRESIGRDPLQFVYRYEDPNDKEVVAFLASALAYGRVEQIERSLDDLLSRLGPRPAEFVRSCDPANPTILNGFKHRFTTADDVSALIESLGWVLNTHGSIEAFFLDGYDSRQPTVIPALSTFCERLTDRYGGCVRAGLKFLLASPARGSACKRLSLFLRWMVRDDEVDVGLWKLVDPAKLIVPVDVHMQRLCRILGLCRRTSASLATAIEITQNFEAIAPDDPVRYDFALSRIGIIDRCNGAYRPECRLCDLFGYCQERENWRD